MQNIQYYWQQNIQSYNFCWRKHIETTYTRNRICEKHASTRVLDHRIKKCIKEDQVEMYQMQTQRRQSDSPTDGGSTPRTTWWTCVPIHSYRSRLLWTLRNQISTTYPEEMVLPLHLPDNERSSHRSRTIIGHRVMSSCCDKIHCKTWLPKYHHQWQWIFVGAANELKTFMNDWDKAKIKSDLAQKKIVWKFNPPGVPQFGGIWERQVQICKKVKIAILDNRSLADKLLSTTMCLVEQTLNARPLTAVSVDPEKIIQNGSRRCRLDLEKMDSRIPSTMEPEIEVVKRTWAKPERRRVGMNSRWLCETLWVHAWTHHWDLHWQRRCCEISNSRNGTWRAEPASREVSASIIRWCFRDGKQGRRCWRHFKSATKAIRARKNVWNWKNLEFVKTQNCSKLKNFSSWDRKSVQPPIFWKAKPEPPEVTAYG